MLRAIHSNQITEGLFRYALNADSRLNLQSFVETVDSENIPLAKQAIVSIRDQIFAEGEASGIALGEARGEAKGIAVGEARGEARGVRYGLIEQVRMLERLLRRTPRDAGALDLLTVEQLQALATALEAELCDKRRGSSK